MSSGEARGLTAPGVFDVFLCHNSADKAQVQEIAERLRGAGVVPWLDVEQLLPGFPAARAIQAQIATVKAAAVFVGANGIGPWQEIEILAFLGELVDRGCAVIPVLLPGCPAKPPLPVFVKMNTWVDLRSATSDSIDDLYWRITGRRLGPDEAAEDAGRRRSWAWRSTVESTKAGVVSVLAVTETIIASAAYIWVAWRFGTLHLTVCACVAPFLLLRTEASVSRGLHFFFVARSVTLRIQHSIYRSIVRAKGIVPKFFPRRRVEKITQIKRPIQKKRATGTLVLLIIGGCVGLILLFGVALAALALAIAFGLVVLIPVAFFWLTLPLVIARPIATGITALLNPLMSIYEIPRNWWNYNFLIDSTYPLEILPGSSALRDYPQISQFLTPWRMFWNFYCEHGSSTADGIGVRVARFTLFHLVILPCVVILASPALVYRWSIKGSAVIYSPLIWIAYSSTNRPLRVFVQDIYNLGILKFWRWFGAFLLILFTAKIYINYSWAELSPYWNSIPGHKLLDAIVAPEVFPPWQIACAANSILAINLYFLADWIVNRWNHGLRVNVRVIEAGLRWLALARGVLSLYTIFCSIYLAASLTGRFDIPPMSTSIFPWR
jgi:TIR domain